jgi:hypothetical protein
MFLEIYNLPARPPLANLVEGAAMALAGTDFARFQLFNTLFSTLVWLPAALLVRHFARGRRGADSLLLLVLMLNPFVLQNATFAWTKLPAAFFALTAVACYVRGLADSGPARRTIAVGAMAAAVLTHYSAAPYAGGLAAAQLTFVWLRRREPAVWRELAAQAVLASALLATWLAWSVHSYGSHATFFSTTIGAPPLSGLAWLQCRAWNLYVTLVPHPLRAMDYQFIAQTSGPGFAHDYFFTIYQTTLPGAFGAAGLVVLLWSAAHRRSPAGPAMERWFWRCFIPATILLGVATAYWRDRWGVAHICLAAVVVIGLTWLTARLGETGATARRIWAAALLVDAILGIALHFYLQATMRLTPGAPADLLHGRLLEFSPVSTKNMLLKLILGYNFVGDGGPPPFLVIALLAVFLVLAVRQMFAARGEPRVAPDLHAPA